MMTGANRDSRVNPAAIKRALDRWDTDAIDALCDVAELGGEPPEPTLTAAGWAALEAKADAMTAADYDAVARAAIAPLPPLTDDQVWKVADLLAPYVGEEA